MEAAAIGAFGALIVLIINRGFSWSIFHDSVVNTCRMTAMIMWIFFGALLFQHIYSAMGAAEMVDSIFTGLEVSNRTRSS